MVNKKGWIRIIEAFISVTLIASILIIVFSTSQLEQRNIQSEVYRIENAILRELQLNSTLRSSIIDSSPPQEWDDSGFPPDVLEKITKRTPVSLECRAKICETSSPCIAESLENANIYARSIMISADSENYDPKQLRIFCWEANV